MLKATKANRVLRIPEERAKDYAALGYTITNMDGKVISKPENPKETVKELQEELAKKDARIAELEAQLGIGDNSDQGEPDKGENEAPDASEAQPDEQTGEAQPDQGEAEATQTAKKPAAKKSAKK